MRKSGRFFAVLALITGTAFGVAAPAATATATPASTAPHLNHVFLIMEENNGFQDVIGNKAAPNLNYLANTFGLETNYYGITTVSSEVNYVALLGGSPYGVTLSFAEHYDGTKSTVVRTPNAGPNFNSFYGLAAKDGDAWAVGEHLNAAFKDRALLEVWNGTSWHIANVPQPGSQRDMLFGASARTKNDVWVVGDQEGANGLFETLAEHWNGHTWSVVRTPDPGSSGNHLYAVDAVGPDNVWAVGQQLGSHVPDQGLVEHWNGQKWSVVNLPASTSGSVLFDGVTVSGGQVWTVGESDTPAGGGQPLVEHYAGGKWDTPALPKLPGTANWANLYGVAVAGGSVWADGTYVDPASDNNEPLVLRETGGTWSSDVITPPGSGANLPGGLTVIGSTLWLAGTYNNGGSRLPLVMHRLAS